MFLFKLILPYQKASLLTITKSKHSCYYYFSLSNVISFLGLILNYEFKTYCYCIFCFVKHLLQIWVNNQKDDLMSSANLDISKRSDWWPAFGRSVAAPLGSVQPSSLLYKPTLEVKTLEGRLEKILRNAIMKLRPTYRYLCYNNYKYILCLLTNINIY